MDAIALMISEDPGDSNFSIVTWIGRGEKVIKRERAPRTDRGDGVYVTKIPNTSPIMPAKNSGLTLDENGKLKAIISG